MIARAVYQPTFHAHVTVTVTWADDLAEVEVAVARAPARRVIVPAAEVGVLRTRLEALDASALVDLDDPYSRDGIGFEGELDDARGRVAFRTGNLDPGDHPDHLAFVTALLEAALVSFPGVGALSEVKRYMR